MDLSLAYDPKKRGLAASIMHPAAPATVDDGSRSTEYAQPESVPFMRDVTKEAVRPAVVSTTTPVASSPAPSQGMTVTRDKFGVEEVKGSPTATSMTGLNTLTNTPQMPTTFNPTARLMDPGELVNEALAKMSLGGRLGLSFGGAKHKAGATSELTAIMQGLTAANNATATAGGNFAEGDLKAQALIDGSRNNLAGTLHKADADLTGSIYGVDVSKDLGIMRNKTDLAQLAETKRHNRAAEGIDWYNAKHKGEGGGDGTTLSKNLDSLVKLGVAKDAKDAWNLINGKKGGKEDLITKIVAAGLKDDPEADVASLIKKANEAAGMLYSGEQPAPAAASRAQQGLTVPKAKRPPLNDFYN